MQTILNKQKEKSAKKLLQGAKFGPFPEVGPLNCIPLNQHVRGDHSHVACHMFVDR